MVAILFLVRRLLILFCCMHAATPDSSWSIHETEKKLFVRRQASHCSTAGHGKTTPSILASGPRGVYVQHDEMTSREGGRRPGSGAWIWDEMFRSYAATLLIAPRAIEWKFRPPDLQNIDPIRFMAGLPGFNFVSAC